MTALSFPTLLDLRHRDYTAGPDCVDWMTWLELEGKSPLTIDSYERTVAALIRAYPDKDVGDFTDSDILTLLRGVPEKSRRTRRAHLSSFFSWARATRRIDENPMEFVPKPRRPAQKVSKTFTKAEVELLTGLPSPDGALMAILLYAGLRKSEARALQVRHVKLAERVLIVRSGKGDKDRVVAMRDVLCSKIAEMVTLEGLDASDYFWYANHGGKRHSHKRMVVARTFHEWFDRCLAAAGVVKGDRTPHSTRHTYATNWLRDGGRLEVVSKQLGHASTKTTADLYVHLDMTDVFADLEAMEVVGK